VPDAAALLDMHPYTLREYLSKGYIESILIGKRPWITKHEIERYQKHGKRDPDKIAETNDFYGED
ncbi:hypothetical protein, partial [Parvimonas sp. M13]|uniref:hypothetical protein n=1 Tax=Parvimonas sp. M13 TaxID=3110694 RepID=UPI002B46B5FD